MWNNGYGMGWGAWMVMGIGAIVFWAVVVWIIRSLLPGRNLRQDAAVTGPDPLALLKERLARGEVTPEEYEQRRRLLKDGH